MLSGLRRGLSRADIVLYGAPFDGPHPTPGARFGPRPSGPILRIETYSPYQDRDLDEVAALDSGDVDIPIGDTEAALQAVRRRAEGILADGKLPFLLGGEHLVTLGAVRAACERYPDLAVVHFDAHADLREDYLGVKLSHASVMRRIWDLLGDGRIFQFGIRSGDRAEFSFAAAGHTVMRRFDFEGWIPPSPPSPAGRCI
jgi:agmatinase